MNLRMFFLNILFLFVHFFIKNIECFWQVSKNIDYECHLNYLCTPGKHLTWDQTSNYYILLGDEACNILNERLHKYIFFLGDSYIRHIYQAFVITMTKNYESGSMKSKHTKCTYQSQFSERNCSISEHLKFTPICNNSATATLLNPPRYFNKNSLAKTVSLPKSVIFISQGNHPVHGGHKRHGINDASAWFDALNNSVCSWYDKKKYPGKIIWVSTHSRIAAYYDDENKSKVRVYNEEMKYKINRYCNQVGYIDVFNMTNDLIINYPEEAKLSSFDMVHWGMEVNLIKVQILLNHLKS